MAPVIIRAMPLIDRVRGWIARASMTFDTTPRPIAEVIFEMSSRAGAVTRSDALSIPAVLRGRNLLCSPSTLPLVVLKEDNTTIKSPFLSQINPNVPNVVTLAATIEDLIFESVSWWRVLAFGHDMYPVQAERLEPSSVSLLPPNHATAAWLPSRLDARGTVWIDGVETPGDQVIRFDSPNPPVLVHGARAIRRALLIDQLAAMYSANPRPLDYFSPRDPAAGEPADGTIKSMLTTWRTARKARATGYVPGWAAYNSVDSPSPADMQLVELQRQASLDLANALGLDPEDLGVSTTSRTYANAVDRRRDRVNDVLAPYMKAITDRLSMGDVTKRGERVIFDLNDYMKSNPTERMAMWRTLQEIGVMTPMAIARAEGIPATDVPAEAEAPAPAEDGGQAEAVPPALAAAQPAAFTFSEELSPLPFGTFANEPGLRTHIASLPLHTFTVDREKRIIEGIAMPYGKTATKYGMTIRFEKGSLKFADLSRVKLLLEHDPHKAIGVAVKITETANGLLTRFKVGRGPEGDKALDSAEDGVLDGLSVGADWDFAADSIPDPRNKGGALIRRADLREVTLTALPAFDDARLTRVAASRNGGSTMECSLCGLVHAANIACPTPAPAPAAAPAAPATFSADQVTAMFAAYSANGGGQVPAVPAVPAPQPQAGPQLVNPTRGPAAIVTEEAPYRFNRQGFLTSGSRYDFSTDLVNGLKHGDKEAMDRAEKFMHGQFVSSADVATLNPSQQRPDLYVDQKEYEYPIWSAIHKGTINDATPFILPKFSSSSGLVAAHAEGVEPTAGTFVATSQTITPTPVSGKITLPREAWDAGGNPQTSGLIWNQMSRAWFEALEASAVTMLEASSGATITITTAAADAALEASLTSQLAPLQYVRGGFRMRDFFVQVDLYKALIAAKDTAGRKLFPVIGAQNATGTAEEFFSSVLVAGLVARPGWALAATGIVTANSFLFDRADVSGWATAPQRITMDNIAIATVTMGIWGYKATANTDATGVRKIAYDPA